MLRFTIRELALVTVIAAVSAGWLVDGIRVRMIANGWKLKAQEIYAAAIRLELATGGGRKGFAIPPPNQ